MARLAGKARGDMRAMEEQMERHNPVNPKNQIYGAGATPSMGLSQFRGGKKVRHAMAMESDSESDEELEGGGFLSDLGIPFISNIAGAIGLGHGDNMVGAAHARRGAKGKARASPMSEATQMGLHLGKHLHSLHGAGFWSDFGNGFMSVIKPVAGIAKMALPFLGPEGKVASGVLGTLGLGKPRRKPRRKAQHMMPDGSMMDDDEMGGGATNSDTGAYHGKGTGAGREREDRAMLGMGTGAGLLGEDGHGQRQMEGGGFLSDLGIPFISNIAGAIGLGHERDGCVKGGRKKRAPAGPSDGRRARAEIVKKVMREKGLKMIEASKYVKEHNLY